MDPTLTEALKVGGWAVAPFAISAVIVLWSRLTKLQDDRAAEIAKITEALTASTEAVRANTDAMRAPSSAAPAHCPAPTSTPRPNP